MAICGNITLEDLNIEFVHNSETNKITAIITDEFKGKSEVICVDSNKFMKALAISVHFEGEPDFKQDYPDAESVQGKVRWIP